MMPLDICTAHQRVSKPKAPVIWVGLLLLMGCLWIGPAGLGIVFAQDTSPASPDGGLLPGVPIPDGGNHPAVLIPEGGEQPAAPMTDIHDIKPVLEMGADLGRLIWLAIAVVVVAALLAVVWWLWRRRKKAAAQPAVNPLPPPEVEAYALLDGLAAEDHYDLKRFYFQLSAILRRYVERRYGFPAAEMTTEELLPAVAGLDLSMDLSQWVREFCLRSDPIKFAGAAADGSRVAHEMAFVRDFVRQTTMVQVETGSDPNTEMKADAVSQSLPEPKKIEYQGMKQGS